MEMAAMVTYIGASIISDARKHLEYIGFFNLKIINSKESH